jgi:hypothetical protein
MARRCLISPDKATFRPPDIRHACRAITVACLPSHHIQRTQCPYVRGKDSNGGQTCCVLSPHWRSSCLHFTANVVCLPKIYDFKCHRYFCMCTVITVCVCVCVCVAVSVLRSDGAEHGWRNFARTRAQILQILKKFFRMPMGILKRKIRSSSLP